MPRNPTGWLYLSFLILLPFAYSKAIVDPALMPRQLFLGVFVLALSILGIVKKWTFSLPSWKQPIPIAVAIYLVFSLLGFTTNRFTAESHAVLSKLLLLFGFLFLTIALLRKKTISTEDLILSGVGFGMVAIGSAAVQLIEKSVVENQHLFRKIEIITGLFANKNLLASILLLCLPFFLMGLQLHRKIKWISLFGIGSTIFILLVVRTRTVLAALLVLGAILLYYYLRSRFKMKPVWIFGGALLLIPALLLTIKIPKADRQSQPDVARHYANRIFETGTLESRLGYWNQSLAMVKEHPVLGVGLGNWQVEFPKYGLEKGSKFDVYNGTQTLQRAHNDFLQVLCESGFLGLIGYLLIFIVTGYRLVLLISKSAATAEKWQAIYLFGGLAAYALVALLDFPMERVEHQVLLMLILAIAYCITDKNQAMETAVKQSYRWPIYLLGVVALYAIVVAGFRYYGERQTRLLYQAKANSQWNDLLFYAKAAQSRFYTTDPTSIPLDWYKGNAYFASRELTESIRCFENAYAMAPYQIQVIDNLATAYRAGGQNEKAETLYLEALRISPAFEQARLDLAALYYSNREFEKAFKTIDQVDIDTKNERYPKVLVPILAHELNRILAKQADAALSAKVAAQITKSEQIIRLYRNARREKASFEAYVTDRNGVFR